MPLIKNLVGDRFGRLLVVERTSRHGRTYYKCLCDCGNVKEICGTSLTGGITNSCGCYRLDRVKEVSSTHRMTGSKELKAWYHMHERCYNANNKKYKYYGGRGINVCDRWHKDNSEGFFNFLKDMGYKPSKKHTIHRVDNNQSYSPDNCIWADYEKQNNCRSNSVRIIIDDLEYTKNSAAKQLNVHVGTIERLQREGYTNNSIVQYLKSGDRRKRDKGILIKRI